MANGCQEIVLSGVDITSWGSDMAGRPRLGHLVRRLLREVPDLPRLRLSSLDPAEPDAELMDVLAEESRLMPHLHISAQHGDDLILRRMKRRHLGRDIIRFCDEARRRRPDVAFGADIIAGFPTESNSAHQQTMTMIKDAGISYLHVFPYSPRQSTPAAAMPQLDAAVIKQRAGALRELGKAQLHQHLETAIGTTDRMLVESGNVGHGKNFAKIKLDQPFVPASSLVDVKIYRCDQDMLLAHAV